MARHTGIPSIIKFGKRLCDLIGRFTPVIVLLFPDDDVVLGLLNAANEACSALIAHLVTIRDYGD